MAPPTHAVGAKERPDHSTGIARLGFVILFVATLASVGVIFGRTHLFPSGWEQSVEPFAESVEAARGTDFVEPVMITSLPASEQQALVGEQTLADIDDDLPMWRALSLAAPDTADRSAMSDIASVGSPVLYSTADGQVYVDEGYARGDRDSLIANAMAVAALDQDFAFSHGAGRRSLDANALVDAHVLQQAEIIQRSAGYPLEAPDRDTAPFTFLPPVIDYRLTAPIVFSDLLAPFDEIIANPLADPATTDPGPLDAAPLALSTQPSDDTDDEQLNEARVMDRSFWFMVFATHLDSSSAYRMSESITEAGVQMVTGDEGSCAVASFAVIDPTAAEQFGGQLAWWVATAAPALGATAATFPDSRFELRSCDPGTDYTSNATFGVGHRLVAWRAAELAATTAIIQRGGADAEIDAAITRLAETPAVVALVEASVGMPATEMGLRARAAVSGVVDETMQLASDGS